MNLRKASLALKILVVASLAVNLITTSWSWKLIHASWAINLRIASMALRILIVASCALKLMHICLHIINIFPIMVPLLKIGLVPHFKLNHLDFFSYKQI